METALFVLEYRVIVTTLVVERGSSNQTFFYPRIAYPKQGSVWRKRLTVAYGKIYAYADYSNLSISNLALANTLHKV